MGRTLHVNYADKSRDYEEIFVGTPRGSTHWRLKLDLLVDRYFEYGHHGVIHVIGFLPDPGLLSVVSIATGDRFYVTPAMLSDRREISNEIEMIAIVALATEAR